MESRYAATTQKEVPAPPIRILLVMDEVVVRTGLRMLLESWPEMKIVGETGKPAEAVAIALREKPDVVLCDSRCGAGELRTEFLPKLVRVMGTRGILLLTAEDDPASRLQAISSGVNGVLYRGKALEELRIAILKVHAGELWLDRVSAAKFILRITRPLAGEITDPAKAKIALLTDRERQIAQLICQGLQNEEIAKRLSISDITVRHHLTSIFTRIGVSSRLELTVFLYRNNLAGPPLNQELVYSR